MTAVMIVYLLMSLGDESMSGLCGERAHSISNEGLTMFEVTEEWLKKYTAFIGQPYGVPKECYVLTKDQALLLNEPWPLTRGWYQRALGKTLTDAERMRFEFRLTKKQARKMFPTASLQEFTVN